MNSMFDIHWSEPAFASFRFSALIRFLLWGRRILGAIFLIVSLAMWHDSPEFVLFMMAVILVFIGIGEMGGRPCRVTKQGIKRFDLGGSLLPINNCRWKEIDRLEISMQRIGKRECPVLSIWMIHYVKPIQIGLSEKFDQAQFVHWAQMMNKPLTITQADAS